MQSRQTRNGFETLTIATQDGQTTATFAPQRGAAASSIVMPGCQGPRELLYQHAFFWDPQITDLPGGWSFCFPVCGRLERQGVQGSYLYQGKIYHMPIHGFAWQARWEVEHQRDDAVTFVLHDTPVSRAMYPFRFALRLHYQVRPGELMCEQSYCNRGDQAMPYYAGFHPYFLTPESGAGKEEVILDYHPVRRLAYNKAYTDLVGEAPLFSLPTAVTHPELSEQLTQVDDHKMVKLRYPGGDVVRLVAEGVDDPALFPYVQLYTMPEKPFFCVEPWMAYPNALNSVDGARWLAPGAEEKGCLRLSLNG